LVWSGLVGLVM